MTRETYQKYRRWMRASISTSERKSEYFSGKQGVAKTEIAEMEKATVSGREEPISVFSTLKKTQQETKDKQTRQRNVLLYLLKAASEFGREQNAQT